MVQSSGRSSTAIMVNLFPWAKASFTRAIILALLELRLAWIEDPTIISIISCLLSVLRRVVGCAEMAAGPSSMAGSKAHGTDYTTFFQLISSPFHQCLPIVDINHVLSPEGPGSDPIGKGIIYVWAACDVLSGSTSTRKGSLRANTLSCSAELQV